MVDDNVMVKAGNEGGLQPNQGLFTIKMRYFLRLPALPQILIVGCLSMKLCSEILQPGWFRGEVIFQKLVFMIGTLVLLAHGMTGGPNYLAGSNLVRAVLQIAANKRLLLLTTIGFMINGAGAGAQDQTGSCIQVDPANFWEVIVSLKVAPLTILAAIGGVGIAGRIMYNRRRAFSDADILNGLMRNPDAARRRDPTFVIHPSID